MHFWEDAFSVGFVKSNRIHWRVNLISASAKAEEHNHAQQEHVCRGSLRPFHGEQTHYLFRNRADWTEGLPLFCRVGLQLWGTNQYRREQGWGFSSNQINALNWKCIHLFLDKRPNGLKFTEQQDPGQNSQGIDFHIPYKELTNQVESLTHLNLIWLAWHKQIYPAVLLMYNHAACAPVSA